MFWSTNHLKLSNMLDNFSEIKVEAPSDKIIRQIRALITSGQLNPGDRLPPERKLAEKFGVGRSVVRDAIRKLEFYGIVKTHPQSGTVIAGMGIVALEGLITDVLNIEETDFHSLVETRVLLEVNAAGRAAERRTVEDIISLTKALDAYEKKVALGESAVEEDLMFHIKVAEASGNKVLKSLMLIITPDIVKNFTALNICTDDRTGKTVQEHRDILNFIINQDSKSAEKSMRDHLKDIMDFSQK
ncbi:MAG: GntR family transcriptional repressor for pyruvate dehydrogenase complex [Saprospiraceae bacterium]|jgi:GntR family transcriptional repressor for pyruvate dehydrogenase complex